VSGLQQTVVVWCKFYAMLARVPYDGEIMQDNRKGSESESIEILRVPCVGPSSTAFGILYTRECQQLSSISDVNSAIS
jgi:hypothetical protein